MQWIAGVDEAGRGSWAGPVVAGAVLFNARFFRAYSRSGNKKLAFLRDSKLAPAKQREAYYHALTATGEIRWGIGVVDEGVIDEINIHRATLLAMRRAIESLRHEPDIILIDGIFSIPDIPYPQECFPHGDRRIFSIAASSIIAKVTRDRLMVEYARKYTEYGFESHKGYGTKSHYRRLVLHGPSPIHRMSYKPIARLAQAK